MDKRPMMKKVTNALEAQKFLKACIQEIGEGFHSDTLGTDYENWKGKRTFTKEQAKVFDTNMHKVFKFIEDPYEIALVMYNHIYGRED